LIPKGLLMKIRRNLIRGGAAIAAMAVLIVGVVSLVNLNAPAKAAPASNWENYIYNLAGSDDNTAETTLNSSNVSKLAVQWTAHGGTGTSARPVVVGNVVYWGDWSGNLRATTISGSGAGKNLWTRALGVTTDSHCNPSKAGIAATPAFGMIGSTPVLYVGGGGNDSVGGNNDYLYAVNATTGAIIWKTVIGAGTTTAGDFAWSSPLLYNDSIYYGMASLGDCPLSRGRMIQINATTGAIQHTTFMVPPGCIAGGIWGTPSIDTSTNKLYVATGTPSPDCFGKSGDLSMSLVELNTSDLSVVAHWQVPTSQESKDGDFGSVPTLFNATIGGAAKSLVGVANKNGFFYAFDRSNIAAGPVWQVRVAGAAGNPRTTSSIDPAAWDGSTLYVGGGAVTIGGTSCKGSVRAMNPANGSFKWQACLTDGSVVGSVSMIPGVIVVTTGTGASVVALRASDGKQLFRRKNTSGQPYWAPATIADGFVFANDMNADLVALAVPASGSTPTPTHTPTSGATSYEAESSANTLTGKAAVAACSACSGGERVRFVGNGSTLQFNGVNVASAGSHTLTVFYIDGDAGRTGDMSVNGGTATTLTFHGTNDGNWNVVQSMSVTVTLKAGNNTILFSNPSGNAPDFDRITVK
jgi:hypothetical protein